MSRRQQRAIIGMVLAVTTALVLGSPAAAGNGSIAGTVAAADWRAYSERFIRDDGRIVDDVNGNISHSEGQGYGLLLAFAAGDRPGFERIWTFTQTELLIRDDKLAAWKWDFEAKPHVTDINNASDGDILIAYALGLAGSAWAEPGYTTAARDLARAIGASLLRKNAYGILLVPAVNGFSPEDRPDGQVVNLSYWVYEAFPVLATLAPDVPWDAVAKTGLTLLAHARFGEVGLPTDWIAIKASGEVRPAQGFPPVFGYNAIRIPLYLLRGGPAYEAELRAFPQSWLADGVPAVVDVNTGKTVSALADPGYVMIAAAIACTLSRTPIPDDLKRFAPTTYYPSTLHLLGLSFVTERHPECL